MSELERRLAAPTDPRGRLISIFVGAVLLPSVALSALSFRAVSEFHENLKIGLYKGAEKLLGDVEKDLEMTARKRALEAARAVGTEGAHRSVRAEPSSPPRARSEVVRCRPSPS